MIGALGSALTLMQTGTSQLDRGARTVEQETVAAAAAPAAPPLVPVRDPAQDLLAGVTELVLSRTTVGLGAATAQLAQEAYRNVLGMAKA